MNAVCNDCRIKMSATKDYLTDLGWMGVISDIKECGGKKAHIKFELCPKHADAGRFAEVLKQKALEQGINLDERKK